jgi:hypothetical protein
MVALMARAVPSYHRLPGSPSRAAVGIVGSGDPVSGLVTAIFYRRQGFSRRLVPEAAPVVTTQPHSRCQRPGIVLEC